MKTVVPQITMFCPTGLGNPNASCRFHRALNNLPPEKMCLTCNGIFPPLIPELIDCPNCKKTLVFPICVSCKKVLIKSTDPLDKITMTVMGEEDIETEIQEAKEGKRKDIDVSTITKESIYRDKRKSDIAKAILEAKKLEDK